MVTAIAAASVCGRDQQTGESLMFAFIRSAGRSLALAGLLAGATALISSPAIAGACPADQFKPNVREAVTTPAGGLTDTVLAFIDLANEPIKANGYLQRIRRLVIEPGGVVPWHSHDDRPALIYIIE